MSRFYEEMKKQYIRGWRTWDNRSVLSFCFMPDGLGLRLGIKDYQSAKLLEGVLIGEAKEKGTVIPYAHTYDGTYTELRVVWGENTLFVQSGIVEDELVILVTPEKQPYKASSLLINGVVLWNREGMVEKREETLCLKNKERELSVYVTADHNGELFTEYVTPYLSVELCEPIGISTGRQRTVAQIREILAGCRANWERNKEKYGELSECYNAMQTCQAWDTVYNPQEEVPITTVSRIWNRNWGGYVLFCWDTYFGALMQSMDEKELAYCNAIEITKTLTPNGFIPNFACQNGFKSYDRSQPPVGSMVCLQMYERHGDKWFLEEVYQNLTIWNEWFMEHRQTKNGLLTWGSDPYEPLFGHHFETGAVNELQGAAYESGLDNSPMYDDIPFDTESHRLLLDDVGLTGLYIHDCRCLSKIAEILGDITASKKFLERAELMENRMEELWDEEFGMYLNRRTDTGAFEYRLSPFHFHALYSHKVGQKRAERIVKEHMMNREEFWGEYVLPSIARNDPAYPDNEYWRGRIWAPMNYLAYMALNEYDLPEARKGMAEKSGNLILKEWLEKGHVHENYNADTGEGCDSNNSDKFYHWGGLLALIALLEFERK